MNSKSFKTIAVLLLTVFMVSPWAFAGEVEVLHWWTSGGEAKSVAVLKDLLEKEGHTWEDMAVAGGAGGNAMTVLKSRAVSGNPPTAAQVKGPQIQQWGDEGVLTNLDDVAMAENWDKLLPKVVADVMKYKGHYVAVPVNVHKINWMWVNPEVFQKSGATIPTTWAEFETAAKKIKEAGFTPVGWGGQPWQEATVWESIVLGVGGADFYRKALIDADPEALGSATMAKCFDTLRMVLQYIDKDSPGRDWNLATSMVIKGKAGMQFMGTGPRASSRLREKISARIILPCRCLKPVTDIFSTWTASSCSTSRTQGPRKRRKPWPGLSWDPNSRKCST